MKKNISTELRLAIDLVLLAGESVMEVFNSFNLDISIKNDKSPLTKADRISNEIICNNLKNTKIPVLSEENMIDSYKVRKSWDKFWLIDPLDGTKEFIKKNKDFTINISLIENYIPNLGVVFCPSTKEMFFAQKGFGSFKVVLDKFKFSKKDKFIKLPIHKPLLHQRIVVSKSHISKKTLEYIDKIDKKEIIKLGSSLKICMVAEGKADIYPRFTPIMEWDVAAATAILIYNSENINKAFNLKFNSESLKLDSIIFKRNKIIFNEK